MRRFSKHLRSNDLKKLIIQKNISQTFKLNGKISDVNENLYERRSVNAINNEKHEPIKRNKNKN